MARCIKQTAALMVALLTAGCGLAEDGGWPGFGSEAEYNGTSGAGTGSPTVMRIDPSAGEVMGMPLIEPAAGGSSAPPQAVPLRAPRSVSMPSTGTFVGEKSRELRGELEGLNGTIGAQNQEYQQVLSVTGANSQSYHATIGAIGARLQVGTTPGNPVLVGQWQTAQSQLDRLVQDSSRLNDLANHIAANADMAVYLQESVKAAYAIQGAVEEDHRQLAILEDDVDRTVVSINRLLAGVNETIRRQNNYAAGERRNLTALARAIAVGESYGPSLSTLAAAPPSIGTIGSPSTSGRGRASSAIAGRAPLVVIRFDRPDVAYQEALYEAVSATLAERPGAVFDLVAVTPNQGGPSDVAAGASKSKKNAERVIKSLVSMGLPIDRVNLSAANSNAANTSEVHVYVR